MLLRWLLEAGNLSGPSRMSEILHSVDHENYGGWPDAKAPGPQVQTTMAFISTWRWRQGLRSCP